MFDLLSKILSWNKKTISGNRLQTDLIYNLIDAENEEIANKAFWCLEEEILRNHGVSDAALNVTICLLSSLPKCNNYARSKSVELFYEILASEPLDGNSSVVEDCVEELYSAIWYLLFLMEESNSDDLYLYVDLICILSVKEIKVAYKAIHFLRKIYDENRLDELRLKILNSSIIEIENLISENPTNIYQN